MVRPMQLQELTESTRISLFHAGWDEKRTWNPEEVALAHLECGLELHAEATRFLSNLGGLVIKSTTGRALFETDVIDVINEDLADEVRGFSAWAGEELALVGSAHQGEKLLMMSDRGTLYVGTETLIVSYGTDICAALNRLCEGERPRKRALLN
jgi:hypothetical protein